MNLTLDGVLDSVFNFFYYPNPIMLTGVNFTVCLVVVWACICRLRLTSTDTLIRARAVFVFVMVLHLVSAFRAPLFGNTVNNWWPILLAMSNVLVLLLNIGEWRRAPPERMQKISSRVPLDSTH